MRSLPGRAFLRVSLALWKRRRHYRYRKWQHYKRTKPEGHRLRTKWWRLYLAADQKVDLREQQLGRLADPARGIDVSNHQPHVDFAAVHRDGYQFVWLKASEGLTFNDPLFPGYVKAAKRAGLKVGAYHFLRPTAGRSGALEARHFATRIRAAGLGHSDLVPVVDVEVTGLARLTPEIPEGEGYLGCAYHEQAATLGANEADMAAASGTENYVAEFIAELQRQLGVRPLIYTFPAFMRWQSTHSCGLWIAHFGVMAPTIPAPWQRYTVWQFTSNGHVAGVPGNCDINKTPSMGALIA